MRLEHHGRYAVTGVARSAQDGVRAVEHGATRGRVDVGWARVDPGRFRARITNPTQRGLGLQMITAFADQQRWSPTYSGRIVRAVPPSASALQR